MRRRHGQAHVARFTQSRGGLSDVMDGDVLGLFHEFLRGNVPCVAEFSYVGDGPFPLITEAEADIGFAFPDDFGEDAPRLSSGGSFAPYRR